MICGNTARYLNKISIKLEELSITVPVTEWHDGRAPRK